MKPIKQEVRNHLLRLMEKAEDAKEDLRLAVESAAHAHEVDKGVLRKTLTAWYKQDDHKLRDSAQQTLDLLDTQPEGIAMQNYRKLKEACVEMIDENRRPN